MDTTKVLHWLCPRCTNKVDKPKDTRSFCHECKIVVHPLPIIEEVLTAYSADNDS